MCEHASLQKARYPSFRYHHACFVGCTWTPVRAECRTPPVLLPCLCLEGCGLNKLQGQVCITGWLVDMHCISRPCFACMLVGPVDSSPWRVLPSGGASMMWASLSPLGTEWQLMGQLCEGQGCAFTCWSPLWSCKRLVIMSHVVSDNTRSIHEAPH